MGEAPAAGVTDTVNRVAHSEVARYNRHFLLEHPRL